MALQPADVLAFNAGGHMVISLIAYDQLDAASRSYAVNILKLHPRFQEDFLADMPPVIRNGSQIEQDPWIFARASTWPDVVRSRAKEYNRGKWHYVMFPTFLSERDDAALRSQLTVNLETEPPADRDAPGMNIIQAYKNSMPIAQDSTSSGADRICSYSRSKLAACGTGAAVNCQPHLCAAPKICYRLQLG